jgi:hypothetical protein
VSSVPNECRMSDQEVSLTGEKMYVLEKGYSRLQSKIKATLVQALRLCTGRTAHRGSRGLAVLFHDHGTRGR